MLAYDDDEWMRQFWNRVEAWPFYMIYFVIVTCTNTYIELGKKVFLQHVTIILFTRQLIHQHLEGRYCWAFCFLWNAQKCCNSYPGKKYEMMNRPGLSIPICLFCLFDSSTFLGTWCVFFGVCLPYGSFVLIFGVFSPCCSSELLLC